MRFQIGQRGGAEDDRLLTLTGDPYDPLAANENEVDVTPVGEETAGGPLVAASYILAVRRTKSRRSDKGPPADWGNNLISRGHGTFTTQKITHQWEESTAILVQEDPRAQIRYG